MSLILPYVLSICSILYFNDAKKTVQPRYHLDILRNKNSTNVISVAASASFYFEGAHSHFSRDMARGWDFFANWLNTERGGIYFNGSNYSITFDFVEDYSSKDFVSKVFTSIVDDYDFFFAPYSSSLANVAADVTDPKGKFMIATAASNTAFFKNRASTFATLPPSMKYLDASFKALSSAGAKVVAVIKDTDYGACGSASASIESAKNNNMTLFKHYDVVPSSPTYADDVARIIADLKNSSVETLVGCTYLPLCYHVRVFYPRVFYFNS
jgi:ABC-type branched-subunit amino acid transport system substrate-binding protein